MDSVSFDFSCVRAVTFDAGGTLLTPHPSVGEVYAEILRGYHIIRNPLVLETSFESAFSSISKNPAVLDPDEREKDFWRQVVRETVRENPIPEEIFPEVFSTMWDTFSHGTRWRVFDGCRDLLQTLRSRGYQLGVLSNWDRRLHSVLRETGLAELVDQIVVSADFGIEKPDTGIFRVAERAMGQPAGACLHVGDSRHHDLTGACHAGWIGILVRNDTDPVELPAIGQLTDLAPLLPGPRERAYPGDDGTGMNNAGSVR
jgi:putative hydrolase of the HAD superfamily